ncbi:MAG TPA: hypothetical protein P5110_09875 [Candidatus Omnitrophota bacterium]|nr:hypothetical protein [Candidatus Omnitrophota bacterium]
MKGQYQIRCKNAKIEPDPSGYLILVTITDPDSSDLEAFIREIGVDDVISAIGEDEVKDYFGIE